MNYRKACENLDIDQRTFTVKELKRKYRLKALLYHPDKNKAKDAVSKFQDISCSYEFLLKYHEFEIEDDEYPSHDDDDDEAPNPNSKYLQLLFSFLKSVLKEEHGAFTPTALIYVLFRKMATTCENTVLNTLENLDKYTLKKIYDIAKVHYEVLHIEKDFIDKIENMILSKIRDDECIILNPMIDDLFENNLYKMTHNGQTIIVPLWHNELTYDISGRDIYVKCFPILADNMNIDNENNLHINVEYTINEIWDKDYVNVNAGKYNYPLDIKLLKLTKEQTVVFVKQGISRINTENVYDVSKRSDVYIHLSLSL